MYICLYVCVYMCMYVRVCAHVHVSMCMYVCTCVIHFLQVISWYTYLKTNRLLPSSTEVRWEYSQCGAHTFFQAYVLQLYSRAGMSTETVAMAISCACFHILSNIREKRPNTGAVTRYGLR